jgi:hypothetical protein
MEPTQLHRAFGHFENDIKKDTQFRNEVFHNEYLLKVCRRVPNVSFDDQLKMHRVLVEPQDGEESDNESDIEEPVATKRLVPVQ